jgi:hypothetical protein
MNLIREADPDSLASLEHQLRSSKLKPTDSIGSSCSEEWNQEIVNGVIDLRSSLIKSQLFWEHATPPSQPRGRLLLYIPSENVSDGASRFASNGFFDAYDCPPLGSMASILPLVGGQLGGVLLIPEASSLSRRISLLDPQTIAR